MLLFIFLKRELFNFFKKQSFKSKTNLFIIVILSLTFIQGIFSAPSTTDSMVYHLPKVVYFIQEKSAFQEVIKNTHDFKAPFGEYIVLQFYLIFGGDRLAFFSQWLAFTLLIYLSGVVASQLSLQKNIQNYARLFTATLPIALMQSASTQVDLVAALLALICLHLSLLMLKKFDWTYGVWLGIVVGLGLFTKATFFFYILIPFFILSYLFFKKPKKVLQISFISLIIIVLIQFQFSSQNIKLYGSILGKHILPDGSELTYTNEEKSLRAVLSNTSRNILVNLPVPIFNNQTYQLMVSFHKLMGLDIDDPKVTCCETHFSVSPVLYPQEDIVANPLHISLILFTLLSIFIIKFRNKNKLALLVFLSTCVSFVMFSAVLKWQPYHPRLEIPFFIVGVISASILLLESKIGQIILKITLLLSCILGITIILLNVSRPYVSYSLFYSQVQAFSKPGAVLPEAFYIRPREEQYFNSEHLMYQPYDVITNKIASESGSKIIKLDLSDDFEYPLWVLLKRKTPDFKIIPLKDPRPANFLIRTAIDQQSKVGFDELTCQKIQGGVGASVCLYKITSYFNK